MEVVGIVAAACEAKRKIPAKRWYVDMRFRQGDVHLSRVASRVVFFLFSSGLTAHSVFGGLIGTSVIDTYFVNNGGEPSPFFGPSTQIIGPGIEFSFSESGDALESDFSDTSLTIHFHGVTTAVAPLRSTFQSLTPGGFAGIAQLTDSFPATTTIGVSSNTIAWTWTGGGPFTNPDFTATYAITSTTSTIPEPGTAALPGLGLAALYFCRRWPK